MIIIRQMKYGFAVMGSPVSAQSSPNSKRKYQMKVAEAASSNIASATGADTNIKIEIDWFADGFHNKPDVDNILKPIQDALKGIVFPDDNQVENIVVRKHDTLDMIRFHDEPLAIISPLLSGYKDYIFIRIY